MCGPIPENLRQLFGPELSALWDPSIPATLNINRIVSGHVKPAEPSTSDTSIGALLDDVISQLGGTFLATSESIMDNTASQGWRSDLKSVFHKLKSIDHTLAPLEILRQQIEAIFSRGRLVASTLFMGVNESAKKGELKIDLKQISGNFTKLPWNSCKLAATLVLIFASPPRQKCMFEAIKLNSQSLGGLPTLQMIRSIPSASFNQAYKKAKDAALSPNGATTVICVLLTDVHIFELARLGTSESWSSFAHSFVVGIGPGGVIIWQSWGEHGYTLDEYLARGGARVRTWEEADEFVRVFKKLVSSKVVSSC